MTRRRLTLATLVSGLAGSTVLDNWRLAVAAVLLCALGWIACKAHDAWPRRGPAAKGTAPL